MAGMKVVLPYTPRPLQRRFHEKRTRFCVLLCHRRFGKTVAAVILVVLAEQFILLPLALLLS